MLQDDPWVKDLSIEELQRLLHDLLEAAVPQYITEQDAMLLALRLGLKSEKCYTLVQTGQILHLSPERIRQRQHFLLRRRLKHTLFLAHLKAYAQRRKLPPGFNLE